MTSIKKLEDRKETKINLRKLEKVKIKKLHKKPINGNFVYQDDKFCYFSKTKCNNLFIENDLTKNKNTAQLINKFKQWQLKFFDVCSCLQNKPSFLLYNSTLKNKELEEHLKGEYQKLATKDINKLNEANPYFCSVTKNVNFNDMLENLFKSRDYETCNHMYLIINSPEVCDIEHLISFSIVARSRKIYLIILVKNIEEFVKKYSIDDLQILKDNCPIISTCNESGELDIYVSARQLKSVKNRKIPSKLLKTIFTFENL